ncbi:MAG: hypothetical protein Q9160_008075 [Pyrenula sp. 1 TL-2023]
MEKPSFQELLVQSIMCVTYETVLFMLRSSLVSAKKYTEDHEWVELSTDGKIGTVGITQYAAKQLGDVVFVELPQKELELKKGDSMGAVESVKSASDIMTPLSGTVLETNSSLEDKPAGINKDPEGNGWLAKLHVKDESELTDLMDAKAYKTFTEDS